MKRNLLCLIVSATLLSLLLSACCGGSGKETTVVTQPVNSVTKGQELQDLKGAQEQGAISEEEFQKAKEKILKSE